MKETDRDYFRSILKEVTSRIDGVTIEEEDYCSTVVTVKYRGEVTGQFNYDGYSLAYNLKQLSKALEPATL